MASQEQPLQTIDMRCFTLNGYLSDANLARIFIHLNGNLASPIGRGWINAKWTLYFINFLRSHGSLYKWKTYCVSDTQHGMPAWCIEFTHILTVYNH